MSSAHAALPTRKVKDTPPQLKPDHLVKLYSQPRYVSRIFHQYTATKMTSNHNSHNISCSSVAWQFDYRPAILDISKDIDYQLIDLSQSLSVPTLSSVQFKLK